MITLNFITLGFATSERNVFPFFTHYVQECNGFAKDLTDEQYFECDIPIEEFLKLFKDDDYQQKILNALNAAVRKKRSQVLEKEKKKEAFDKQKLMREKLKD